RAIRIEHIGSTAVPGLDAKPIIDVLLEVDNVADAQVRAALEKRHFTLIVDETGHRMFRSPSHGAHLHVWQNGDTEMDRHLLFRDWLRQSDEDRQLYQRENRRLAAIEWPSQNDYAQAKSSVIAQIIGRAKE